MEKRLLGRVQIGNKQLLREDMQPILDFTIHLAGERERRVLESHVRPIEAYFQVCLEMGFFEGRSNADKTAQEKLQGFLEGGDPWCWRKRSSTRSAVGKSSTTAGARSLRIGRGNSRLWSNRSS